MAKRSQTTGQPRRKRRTTPVEVEGNAPAREFQTRAEREEAIQKLIVQVTTITLAVIAVIIVIALVYTQLIVPGQVVATVNGENITVSAFQDRVRFERARLQDQVNRAVAQAQSFGLDPNQLFQQQPYSTWLNELNFPDQLGQRVLNDMIDDELIDQEAEALNISIDDEQVQDSINNYFGYDPTQVALIGVDPTETPTPTITPTPFVSPTPSPIPTNTPTPEVTLEVTAEVTAEATDDMAPTIAPSPTSSQEEIQEQFDENVDDFRTSISQAGGINTSVIDAYFQRQATRDAVRDEVIQEAETATYANLRHILVATEEEAQEIIASLENGESFAALARAVSTDTGSGARGGELGWSPLSNFVEPFADAARDAQIGAIVGPVESEFGFHILQVRAREEREVEEAELDSIRSREFAQWLDTKREESEIEIFDIWADNIP